MLKTLFEWAALITVAGLVLYAIKAVIWLTQLLFPVAAGFFVGCMIVVILYAGVRRYGY